MIKIDDLKQIIKGQRTMPHVFLLWGEEAFLRNYYKNKLIELLMPEMMEDLNVFRFEGKDYRLDAVDEAIEALPVLAERKLLIFTESLIFKPDGRSGAKGEYRDYWAKRLQDIPDYVYILFDESEIAKNSALLKKVDKEGACVEFSYVTEGEMVRWTQRLFANYGKEISVQDARYLNEITQEGMMAVRREVEKLVAYAGEETTITRKHIDDLVTPPVEGQVFEMVAAMLRKDADKALHMLEDLLILKTEPIKILGAIVYNADKLLTAKLLMNAGADKSQIMSEMKISPFMASKFMKDCAKYSIEQLRELVGRLAETDGDLKSNSMDNEMLLNLLVTEASTVK